MVVELTRLTHKIVIQLQLVAESCTIYSSHSSWPASPETLGYTLICVCVCVRPIFDSECQSVECWAESGAFHGGLVSG